MQLTTLKTFNCACAGAKDLIIYGVGEDSVVTINQQYVGYWCMTPKQIMQHVRNKTCIKMTTLEKDTFKKDGYSTPWYTTTDVNIYWKYLDNLTKKLDTRDIATSDNEKFRVSVAQMWESNYLT